MDETSCHCPLFFPSSFLEQSFLWRRNQLSQNFLFRLHCLSFLSSWVDHLPDFTVPPGSCPQQRALSALNVGVNKNHHSLPSNTDHCGWKLYLYIFTIILPGSVFALLRWPVPISPSKPLISPPPFHLWLCFHFIQACCYSCSYSKCWFYSLSCCFSLLPWCLPPCPH